MKTRVSLLPGLLLVFLGAVQAQTTSAPEPAQWKRYTVKDEEFSVALPTLPAMVTHKEKHAQKDRRKRLISTSADGVSYSINIYENPKPRQSLEEFIAEEAGDGLELKNGREVKANGFSGKEYAVQLDGQPRVEQFFATETRLYRFVTQGARADHPGVKQFFASVTLGSHEGIAVSDGPGLPLETKPAGETAYTGREVDKKAKLQSYPPPEQPDTEKARAIRGTVILKVVFTADGRVTNIRVVQGLPYGLTERAIEAAKKIKFIPATKDGKAVSMWMQLEYNFNLY